MKNLIGALLMVMLVQPLLGDGIYLWEYNRNGDTACCLSLSGNDICNEQTACTGNVATDILGINDYIGRLLGLEKAGAFSYGTILNQAQYYIKHVLNSSITRLSYRKDIHRNVKFFREMVDMNKPAEKAPKVNGAQTASAGAAGGPKKDDPVFAYLVKMGLARPWDSMKH